MASHDSLLKRIELFVRRTFTQRWLGKPPRELVAEPHNVLKLGPNAKILFLRQDRIGDVLVTTPLMRLLRRKFPHAQIDMLLSNNNFAVRGGVAHNISSFWRYTKKVGDTFRLIKSIRTEKYDVIIDLMDNTSATSSYFIQWMKPRFSVGIVKENAAIYTHCVPLLDRSRVHIVERIAQLLLPFGINPKMEDLSLEYRFAENELLKAQEQLGAKSKKLRLGIHLAGSTKNRFWGEENYRKFFSFLKKDFPQIEPLIFIPPGYEVVAQNISEENGVATAPAAKSFHEFAAMLHQCDLIFTPDTSTVHLAAAWKKPCLVMYNDYSPHLLRWTPYNSPFKALYTADSSIAVIAVDQVMGTLSELLCENDMDDSKNTDNRVFKTGI
ncbi:MAG TPA: glycosyltransferase family 9 protein [Patescibacteria group bacterium]|nr:glycosyltransferase family 9 protein [Patescibacteria group bacterium]